MAVRLDLGAAPLTTATESGGEPEPAPRLRAHLGLALLKLSGRRSGPRWPRDAEPTDGRRQLAVEDHFVLRTLCRA